MKKFKLVLATILCAILFASIGALAGCSASKGKGKDIKVLCHYNDDTVDAINLTFKYDSRREIAQYAVGQHFWNLEIGKATGIFGSKTKVEKYTDHIPQKEGYTLEGIYDTPGELVEGDSYIDGDGRIVRELTDGLELWATWLPNTYTLYLDATPGTLSDHSYDPTGFEYQTGDTVAMLPVPTPYNGLKGITFTGWQTASNILVSDGNGNMLPGYTTFAPGKFSESNGTVYLYAKYAAMRVTVYKHIGDETETLTAEVGRELNFDAPSSPEGMRFDGYYTGVNGTGTKVSGVDGRALAPWSIMQPTHVYAHFIKEHKFKVMTAVSGTVKSINFSNAYGDGDTINITPILADGYEIDGWYSGEELVCPTLTLSYVIKADTELTIKCKPKTYTVKFDKGNAYGTVADTTVTFGKDFQFPIVYQNKSEFVGWKLDDQVVTKADGTALNSKGWTIAKNVVLKPAFKESDTGVVFNAETLKSIPDKSTGTYIVLNDIDMRGVEYTPVEFGGTLVGGGFTIRNLNIDDRLKATGLFTTLKGKVVDLTLEVNVNNDCVDRAKVGGLCGELSGATVENVTVKGSVTGGMASVGGIAGEINGGNTVIKNCKNYATVTSSFYDESACAGGITGKYGDGAMTDCANYGSVYGYAAGGCAAFGYRMSAVTDIVNHGRVEGRDNTGGVVGFFECAGYINATYAVRKLENAADAEVIGYNRVGGVVGHFYKRIKENSDTLYTVTFTNLKNEGKVTGRTDVGGIIGKAEIYSSSDYYGWHTTQRYIATSLVNTGEVKGDSVVGGLFGYAISNAASEIRGCTGSGKVTADFKLGGIGGHIDNAKIVECFNTGLEITATGSLLEDNISNVYLGGFVGIGSIVENCTNTVDITYTGIGARVGGIGGRLYGNARGVSNTGNITALTSDFVGGIAGIFDLTSALDIRSLDNTGEIKGKNYVGGVAGAIYSKITVNADTAFTSRIGKLSNSGKVTGAGVVGGCVGDVLIDVVGLYLHHPSHKLNITELTQTGVIECEGMNGALIGSVVTCHGDSLMRGYVYKVDGEVMTVTDPTVLIAQRVNFKIELI